MGSLLSKNGAEIQGFRSIWGNLNFSRIWRICQIKHLCLPKTVSRFFLESNEMGLMSSIRFTGLFVKTFYWVELDLKKKSISSSEIATTKSDNYWLEIGSQGYPFWETPMQNKHQKPGLRGSSKGHRRDGVWRTCIWSKASERWAKAKRVFVSAAGVRCAWLRHDLHTFQKRLQAFLALNDFSHTRIESKNF